MGRVYDALVKVNSLLTVPEFARVISRLLEHRDRAIRKRALQLLAERVARAPASAEAIARRDSELLAALAAPLLSVVAVAPDDDADSDEVCVLFGRILTC